MSDEQLRDAAMLAALPAALAHTLARDGMGQSGPTAAARLAYQVADQVIAARKAPSAKREGVGSATHLFERSALTPTPTPPAHPESKLWGE